MDLSGVMNPQQTWINYLVGAKEKTYNNSIDIPNFTYKREAGLILRRMREMEFQELMDCYYLSEEDNNRVVYKKLLEMMKKQNVIPVIGAGLSCWAYPL